MNELSKFILDLKIEKKKEFIEHIENVLTSAIDLEHNKRAGALLQTRQINRELRGFKKKTEKYQRELRLLKDQTKSILDAMHINDDFKLGSKDPLDLILNNVLEQIKNYCQAGDTKKDGDEPPELHNLEVKIAQQFVACGGEIEIEEGKEFMTLLKYFRDHLKIEGFHSDSLSSTYINRIKKRM